MKGQKTLFSSASDEWETPNNLFNRLNAEFNFTLDPCATKENAKCKKFYTKKDDGLRQSWHGEVVFCNPPYSNIGAWVEKANIESLYICTVVMLIPARVDTKWFHKFIYNADLGIYCNRVEVRFLKGRLKFSNSKNSAPFPSMIVVFR